MLWFFQVSLVTFPLPDGRGSDGLCRGSDGLCRGSDIYCRGSGFECLTCYDYPKARQDNLQLN
jgi:hypothetical protein